MCSSDLNVPELDIDIDGHICEIEILSGLNSTKIDKGVVG